MHTIIVCVLCACHVIFSYSTTRALFTPGSLPFFDLTSGLPGVKELPRVEDATSDPIYIKPAMPLQFASVGKAHVSGCIHYNIHYTDKLFYHGNITGK